MPRDVTLKIYLTQFHLQPRAKKLDGHEHHFDVMPDTSSHITFAHKIKLIKTSKNHSIIADNHSFYCGNKQVVLL